MIGRLATVLLLLFVPASFGAAQDTASGGGDFCATAPQELLAALDGSWNLTQGPGIAIGGPPLPLPAHPPVAMGLEYNAEGGYAILSGQGQQMIMLPTATETASDLLGGLNENFVTSTEGMVACDWYALPTLMGTNVYDLSGFTTPSTASTGGGPSGAGIDFCVGEDYYLLAIQDGQIWTQTEWDGPPLDHPCHDLGTWVDGDMKMTIALKFDSPASARGMLSFRGEQGGYHFAAWAPITMSR